jgi:hypothetical protein
LKERERVFKREREKEKGKRVSFFPGACEKSLSFPSSLSLSLSPPSGNAGEQKHAIRERTNEESKRQVVIRCVETSKGGGEEEGSVSSCSWPTPPLVFSFFFFSFEGLATVIVAESSLTGSAAWSTMQRWGFVVAAAVVSAEAEEEEEEEEDEGGGDETSATSIATSPKTHGASLSRSQSESESLYRPGATSRGRRQLLQAHSGAPAAGQEPPPPPPKTPASSDKKPSGEAELRSATAPATATRASVPAARKAAPHARIALFRLLDCRSHHAGGGGGSDAATNVADS